jgi:gentisate 1,2-dioxygenase
LNGPDLAHPIVERRKRGKGGVHPYVAYLRARYPDYATWVAQQGVPVITGRHVEDCRSVPLAPWPALGGEGVLINLSEQVLDDAYVCAIPPGGQLRPQHHLYEALVYVVSGRGASSVWNDAGAQVRFEWQAGSMFALPLNVHYQHFNTSGVEPARLLVATSAPLTINLFHNLDFVFNCPLDLEDRFDGRDDFFGGDKVFRDEVLSGLWETNFIADIRQLELREHAARGKGQSIFLALSGSTMKVHVSRFPVGTYKKAHRHGPGAHIYVLGGEGYTLMWMPGEEPQRYDWHEGSLVSPPNGCYHQHFNTGSTPATYLALHRPQVVYNKGDSDQIEYEDEDPAIRDGYLAELRRKGVTFDMAGVSGAGKRSQQSANGSAARGPHPYVAYLKNHFWSYQAYQQEEALPIVRGFHVEDVAALPLAPWERMGGRGTFINLSEQEMDDAYVFELAPRASSRPQRHLFEEIIYVLRGRGATSVHQADGAAVEFEWHAGSLFAIPLNASYQHFNHSGEDPAVLLGVTSAPLLMNLFHSRQAIFDCPYVFNDRFAGRADEFQVEPKWREDVPGGLWETNFFSDVRRVGLVQWEDRGKAFKHVYIALAGNVMKVHLAEFAVGTYKKAHRHGPGAHILILNGEGYSLMGPPGEEPQRFDWGVGSLISPPAGWYHQHFNLGDVPVFHLAFHRPQSITSSYSRAQIEYEDEEPEVRALFERELARRNIESQMGPPFAARGVARV